MIAIAFGGAFVLYAVVGVAGCAYARCVGSEVPSNVLLMFDEHDPTASAMRLALSLVLLIQLPLVCLPCRLMLTSLLAFCADCAALSSVRRCFCRRVTSWCARASSRTNAPRSSSQPIRSRSCSTSRARLIRLESL